MTEDTATGTEALSDGARTKLAQLREILTSLQGVVVAFSGGVDSSLVLAVARECLKEKCLAATATSETYSHKELDAARAFARKIGAEHCVFETSELGIEGFRENPPDRCYFCKHELFSKLRELAGERGLAHVADGANADDRNDHRPGMRAGAELAVRSPLMEAGITKDEVREISRALGLPTWGRPARACLASRFPYGSAITADKLVQVAAAEDVLDSLGFTQFRVRHHGDVARIEVPADEVPRLVEPGTRAKVVAELKRAGFTYVTVDLQGFRSGSMNEILVGDSSPTY